MSRELPRTLYSLSRDFQLNSGHISWEIIVVDNGSIHQPNIPKIEPVPKFIQLTNPSPSPVLAMNTAISAARSSLIGAWIDGARLASANLVSSVYQAQTFHPSPVIAVPNRQFGSMRQSSAAEHGYCQELEDKLLFSSGWPSPHADLDAISWSEEPTISSPMLETNALFLRKQTWEKLGGYDPQFSEAGGGMCNPDVFQRAINLQETQLIRISNCATYHQYHDGTTTQNPTKTLKAVKDATRNYFKIRGQMPRKQKQIGWLYDAKKNCLVTSESAS
uniref:glycosyltransferase family 2 protein n=1 Tax=Synechococcus sp. UW106 TaxID=368495 RepID=UPI0010BCFD15|nr:glycosyltransferase family 2 protein [Synechococcus sp. UW106]